MPDRQKAELSQLRNQCPHHLYKSSNDDLYTFAVHSFHPTPYPAMRENRRAGCNPIYHPDKKGCAPKCAIRAGFHFPLSMSRIHGRPYRSCHYKRHKSLTTCHPDEKRWDSQSYDNYLLERQQARIYTVSSLPRKSVPSVPAELHVAQERTGQLPYRRLSVIIFSLSNINRTANPLFLRLRQVRHYGLSYPQQ